MAKSNPLKSWLDSLAHQHSPDFNECQSYLACYFPLLNAFINTEQDARWHAEGNVAIHTNMVLNELYDLLRTEAGHIKGEKRQALILSALLHDIAKPITTRRKDIAGEERVVAPKHEDIGAGYLALRLMALPLCHRVVMMILGLVGFHHMPKLLVVRDGAFNDYLQLSLSADLELLFWLEMADMNGRICEDLDSQLDLLAQFRMFAEEYCLWGISHPEQMYLQNIQVKTSEAQQRFVDGYAIQQLSQGAIVLPEEAIAKNYQACQHYSHFYVMCGVSGSGKSTWITQNLPGVEVISLDEIRAELNGRRGCQKNRGQVLQLAKSRLKTALAHKRDVVWDATNIRQDFRRVLCQLGERYGALVTLVVFHLPPNVIYQNNRARHHVVSDEVLSEQIKKLQWPWRIEGHRMLFIGEHGQALSRYGTF
ncbi:hypothetical protein JF50_25380 [Pseudoalteromonas luteoviolacea]|uniref:HD domain-containing protein n=1 Tax=Pseudoalteromonas luteoviolacea TaxID=43657 RepID=A0A0C1QJ58_9GAMM|nr:AAA family ATPase [Pseudoalteromonas luteoviolacea]KID55137.1 hypothetical protein JF50_25380 [Pseudoalteromonas luteoviolacea]